MLLSGLFGNETAEKILFYMENYEASYARKISKTFEISVSQVQRQLERFEREGILISRLIGKTRQYEFNPRYLFKNELRALLNKALKSLPQDVIERYFTERTRPRRKGKPL
jgi:predicted transcriptional regulator